MKARRLVVALAVASAGLAPAGADDRLPADFKQIIPRGRIASVDEPSFVPAQRAKLPPGAWVFGVVVGGFVVGASLLLVFFLVLGWKRPPQQQGGVLKVALTVVPVPSATPTATLLLTPTLDSALVPTPLDGDFALDSYVKVVEIRGKYFG